MSTCWYDTYIHVGVEEVPGVLKINLVEMHKVRVHASFHFPDECKCRYKNIVSLCGKFGANYMPRIPCNYMGGTTCACD